MKWRNSTRFVVKRLAPVMGSWGPARVTVAAHAVTYLEALEKARAMRAERGRIWVERRDARAHALIERKAAAS